MIAFRENYNLYVMPALKGPQNLAAEKSGNALPVSKVSYGGATYPSWTTDNQLNWTLGPTLFSVDAKDAMADDFEPPPRRQNHRARLYRSPLSRPARHG